MRLAKKVLRCERDGEPPRWPHRDGTWYRAVGRWQCWRDRLPAPTRSREGEVRLGRWDYRRPWLAADSLPQGT